MEIKLNDDYRITDDPLQYILQRKMIHKETGKEYWVNEGYYGSFEFLVRGLLNREIHGADIHTLQQIIDVLKASTEEICHSLTAMER